MPTRFIFTAKFIVLPRALQVMYVLLQHSMQWQASHPNSQRYTSSRSSVDSDLEASSHNPSDGSFAPLAVQPSANDKCLNQRLLSY